jgi:hypothetical protein
VLTALAERESFSYLAVGSIRCARVAGGCRAVSWVGRGLGSGDEPVLDELVEAAARGYRAAFPSSGLVKLNDRGSYLLDLPATRPSAGSSEWSRPLGRSSAHEGRRESSRLAGFPTPRPGRAQLRARPCPGHAIGSGLDETCSPRLATSTEAARQRAACTAALNASPKSTRGACLFRRMVYGDPTDVQDLTQFTVGAPLPRSHSGLATGGWMSLQRMEADTPETLVGVVRLLRRAAELDWAAIDADGAGSPRQVLALGIDLAADAARNLLPDAIAVDGPVQAGHEAAAPRRDDCRVRLALSRPAAAPYPNTRP